MRFLRWPPFLKPRVPDVPNEAVEELASYLDLYATKLGLTSPKLKIESQNDRPTRIAFYRPVAKEVVPNSHLLASTWGKGPASEVFWKAIMAHEFGHHVQYLNWRLHSHWFRRLLQRISVGVNRKNKERQAWAIAVELTGITRIEAYKNLRSIRPSTFRFLRRGDFKGLIRYWIDGFSIA